MLGRRKSRPDAGADASAGANTVASATASPILTSSAGASHIDLMSERLQRIQDEQEWENSHTALVMKYNRTSLAFWLLCICSLCFALLKGYHGFAASGGWVVGASAIIIAALYATIELTVPVSAHLMSWGSKGQSRWAIRLIGLSAYILGVAFSLLILQGKFSSGAGDSANRTAAAEAIVSMDQEQLKTARATAAALRPKVGDRSADSFMSEMKSILATSISKRDTLGDVTDECQGAKRDQKQRDLCGKYDGLRLKHADAIALARAEATIEKAGSNLLNKERSAGVGMDVQDKIFARVLGTDITNIQLFKASFIAVMAALLTHLLWAAHGMTVNHSIAKRRDETFEQKALGRALERDRVQRETAVQRAADEETRRLANIQAETEAAERRSRAEADRVAAETQAAFMAAKNGHQIATAVANAPLREQPVAIQVQRYFTERSLMGADFTMPVGLFHDDYNVWCRGHQLQAVTVDRFVELVKQIGLHISVDGRIVGAALRTR
jgi:hypothetical protein